MLLGSWWESAQNERDSYTALHEPAQELLTVFGGTVTVAGWEAAVFRRGDAQPGAGFRLVGLGFDPAAVGRLVESFEATALPGLESWTGSSAAHY